MGPRYTLCTLTSRGIFIAFNVLYSVVSLALLGLGLALVVVQVNVTYISGSDLYTGGTIVAIAGALAFLLSLLGIAAAASKIRVLLGAYIFILVVTLILSEAGGLIGLLYKPYINEFPKYFQETMGMYHPSKEECYNPSANNAIDHYQKTYHCCGSDSAHDWEKYSDYLNTSAGHLPQSCSCNVSREHDDSCTNWQISYNGRIVNQTAWSNGCSVIAMSELSSSTYALSIMGVASGILQIPGLILAIALIVFISRNRYQGYVQI